MGELSNTEPTSEDLLAAHEVGEGVRFVGIVKVGDSDWHKFIVGLQDPCNPISDWTETTVTVSMTLGGGNVGRDHWGWPGDGFAADHRGAVNAQGSFFYYIQRGAGSSSVVASVFRWKRKDQHGVSARMFTF